MARLAIVNYRHHIFNLGGQSSEMIRRGWSLRGTTMRRVGVSRMNWISCTPFRENLDLRQTCWALSTLLLIEQ
jgi:hypothetical protein